MKDRLLWLIRNNGDTLTGFGKRMGVSKQTVINYKDGKTVPDAEKIANLYRSMPDLNLRWLIVGEGEPFNENPLHEITRLKDEILELHRELKKYRDAVRD